jgi:hypothetical protein
LGALAREAESMTPRTFHVLVLGFAARHPEKAITPQSVHHHHSKSSEQIATILAELEKERPPAGSPHRRVLDDMEYISHLSTRNNKHVDNLEVERQHLLNMRRSHVDDYRHDEKVIDIGTTHLDRVSTAVSQIAESWLQSAKGHGDNALVQVEHPDFAGATTAQDPDEESPPASIMAADEDESSFLEGPTVHHDLTNREAEQNVQDETRILEKRLKADMEGKPLPGPDLEPDGDLDHKIIQKYRLEALEDPPRIPKIPHISFHLPWHKDKWRSGTRRDASRTADANSLLQLDFRRRRLPTEITGITPELNGTSSTSSSSTWVSTGDKAGNATFRAKMEEIQKVAESNVVMARNTTLVSRASHTAIGKAFDDVANSTATSTSAMKAAAATFKQYKRDQRRRREKMVSVAHHFKN